jgi:tetratricopeptide (TPR) repeat protein
MMPSQIAHIELESEKRLTIGQELDLLRAAHKRTPTVDITSKLVKVLVLDDQFEEAVALLEEQVIRDYRNETFLTICYLSRETQADNNRALDAASRSFALSDNDKQRAAALAAIGKCEKRLGQVEQAKSTLRRALAYDPHNKDACKRLAAIMLDKGEADGLLDWTDGLQAQGVNHARLFGARVLGFARKGDIESSRVAEGFQSLHRTQQLDPPSGWTSIEEFNAALAVELVNHPAMRCDRYGSASESTWRIENPSRPDTPLFKALIAQIIKSLSTHISALAGHDHPWTLAVPEKAFLRNWCVITESTGFETWHVHQFGWLSGVYYVQIPDVIAHGVNKDGCLAFGIPEELVGEDISAQFGQHIVRPRPGMMLTFPSHTYHRTFAHGAGEKRICVAFDLRPL